VLGMAQVSHGGIVTDQARVNGEAKVRGGRVAGRVSVKGRAWVNGAHVDGDRVIDGDTVLRAEAGHAAGEQSDIDLRDEDLLIDSLAAIDSDLFSLPQPTMA